MKKTKKFKQKEAEKLLQNLTVAQDAENPVEIVSKSDGTVDFCGEHRKIVSDFLNSDIALPREGESVLQVENILIEPLSDMLYSTDGITLGDVIELDGKIFPVGSSSQVDYVKNYKLRNIREIILNNSLLNASNVVKAVTDNIKSGIADNKFYLLSDSTDVFGKNIKSAFYGYRTVWRSIAAAYTVGKFNKLTVVDFMADRVTRVTVGAEFSKKYKRIIYTRTDRKIQDDLKGLSYSSVSRAFTKHLLTKNNCRADSETISNIAVSNKLYNVMCRGNKEIFVVGHRLLCASGEEYRHFITDYLADYKKLQSDETCMLWADHLKAYLKGAYFVDNEKLTGVLKELDYRVKNKIPLWSETLPSLKLDRAALHGRLGNYYLVKQGEKVENTFENKVIKCPEVLDLPAGEKEIIFPLSISGVSDKHYIAKVKLEKPFEKATQCNVGLIYDFDNETTYTFNLYDKDSGKSYNMYIEEGEPEKSEKPFEMRMDADVNGILERLNDKINELNDCVANRKNTRSRPTEHDYYRGRVIEKEKPWEYDSRILSNEIYSLWLRLPYDFKKRKSNFKKLHNAIETIEYNCSTPDYYDDLDLLKVIYLRCVLALFIEGYDITLKEFEQCIGTKEGRVIASRTLCNPSIKSEKLINRIIESAKENRNDKIRLLSLPLIANNTLLEYMADKKMQSLGDLVRDKLHQKLESYDKQIKELKAGDKKLTFCMKELRDYWEFSLGVLRLRDTKWWNDNLNSIVSLKDLVVKLEEQLFLKLKRDGADSYYEMCAGWQWTNERYSDICITRIMFSGIPESLNFMHPLAYTLITYLEGNPNTHVIGCGLKEDD